MLRQTTTYIVSRNAPDTFGNSASYIKIMSFALNNVQVWAHILMNN